MYFANKWKRYFLEQPRPAAVFQIAPSYFAGLKMGLEKRLSESDFIIQRIPSGVIEANFLQSNIKQPEILEQLIDQALHKLKPSGNSVTIILPETSCRVFVFSLEGSFLTPLELAKFIEWRLNHQLAQPLSDLRYSYQTFNSGRERKVLVVCSGLEIIKEYETIFQKKKLQPGKLTIPSLSTLNLLPEFKEEDFLVVDADLDYLSLIAVVEGSLYLYRQKQLLPGRESGSEVIVKEVENTLYFIEDKARKRIGLLALRSNLEGKESLKDLLQMKTGAKVLEIMPENRAMVPLLGGW
jgi:Tfp pilus assembly PilM family ATPase